MHRESQDLSDNLGPPSRESRPVSLTKRHRKSWNSERYSRREKEVDDEHMSFEGGTDDLTSAESTTVHLRLSFSADEVDEATAALPMPELTCSWSRVRKTR